MIHNYVEIFWPSGPEKYSIRALPFQNHQSKPRLRCPPDFSRALSFDSSIENTTITVDLDDHDKYFEKKLENEQILGKKIQYCTFQEEILFTGWVASPPKSENKIFKLKADIFTPLKAPINKALKQDDYQDIPTGNSGKYSNIILGNETEGWYTARRIDDNTFHAAWNPLSDITKVQNENQEDILSEINLTIQDDISYIEYTSGDNYIYFSAKGPENQGNLIENPIEMFEYLIKNFTGLEIEDLTEMIELYENRNYSGNLLFITDKVNIEELFKTFSQSYHAKPILTRAGKVNVKSIRWGNQTPTKTIQPSKIKGCQKWKEVEYCKNAWTRRYSFDPKSGSYIYTPQDLEATTDWSNQIGELNQKFLISDRVSYDVGLRDKFLRENPLLFYSFQIPLKDIQEVDLGDVIEFKHRDSYHPDEYRMIQVLREKSQKKSSFIFLEGYDISGIQKKTFTVYSEGDPRNPWVYEEGNPENPLAWFQY
ncbi:MAG: hypothetical protein JSV88_25575 [Candidatus Aminicenantes bacterium]|nr:MAG: hypothetical protein JSV88_25575 [Candidatus Aminicenantes bacterium]